MTEEIKEILYKFDKVLENYELDKKTKSFSVDSICHLFPNEMITIKNYITNLQKENENLLYEINGYLKEKEELKEKINKLEDYKSRNEKAVEYIKEWWYEKNTRDINRIVSLGDKRIDLYNILQGENDD